MQKFTLEQNIFYTSIDEKGTGRKMFNIFSISNLVQIEIQLSSNIDPKSRISMCNKFEIEKILNVFQTVPFSSSNV